MRLPGPAEIVLIIIIAGIVLLGIKVFGTPPQSKTRKVTQYEEADEEDYDERVIKTRRSRTQILGIVAIVVGVIILLSTLSLVKWVFWGPIGAFIIIVIGIATILIARRSSQ
jgi:fatty acid desaturase